MTQGYQLIAEDSHWQDVAARIRAASALAVDLEADGFHRYPERVSLIQVALPEGELFLIDPLALEDLGPLGEALATPDRPAIFHSAAYDVRAMDRDLGYHLGGLVDTSIQAQFCGAERTGLGNVLADELGVELPKPKRLQRMDWSRRPLPEEALAYAADDVAYLHQLSGHLADRLESLGRSAWADEECRRLEQVRHDPPPPPEEAAMGLKGARDLGGRGRALLRSLYVFRESEALRIGRPPYRVMTNQALMQLAKAPDSRLDDVRGIHRVLLQRKRGQLLAALDAGKRADPVPWPRGGGRNPWTPEARERLSRLKSWRQAEANRLSLGPGLIWSAKHLDRVALYPDRDLRELDEGEPAWVRNWQWTELGESLAEAVAGL